MNSALKQAFETEMNTAMHRYRKGHLSLAFTHLERAHILGQRHVLPHVRSHWWMLKTGIKRRSAREVSGQAIRILLGAVGSAVGIVPTGNPGGIEVGMFQRVPISADLKRLLDHE